MLDDKVYSTGSTAMLSGDTGTWLPWRTEWGGGFGEEALQTALGVLPGLADENYRNHGVTLSVRPGRSNVNRRRPGPFKNATTLAGVYIDGDDLITFNVGDSRVYRIRRSHDALTHDHSEVQELLDHEYIDEAEAMNHPKRVL